MCLSEEKGVFKQEDCLKSQLCALAILACICRKNLNCPNSPLYSHRHPSFMNVQPIADKVAKNLEIVVQNFQFCTRQTSILMGFVINTMLIAGTNRKFHGQNSGSLKKNEIIQMISRYFATLPAVGCKNFYDECHRSFMNVLSFVVYS